MNLHAIGVCNDDFFSALLSSFLFCVTFDFFLDRQQFQIHENVVLLDIDTITGDPCISAAQTENKCPMNNQSNSIKYSLK